MKLPHVPDRRAARRDRARFKAQYGMRFDGGAPLAAHRPPSRRQLRRLMKKQGRL